jgi:membrane protein implicated in regulation of membrane protease activity
MGAVTLMSGVLAAFAVLAIAKWSSEYVWLLGGYVAAIFALFVFLYRKGAANLKYRQQTQSKAREINSESLKAVSQSMSA